MSEIIAGIITLAAIALVGWSQWQTRQQVADLISAEDRRVREWWSRIQSDVDNLRDRVNSKTFETYAQASHVEKPSDQPTFTAEGEFNVGGMGQDLLEVFRQQQRDDPYAGDMADLAEDYAGPIVG